MNRIIKDRIKGRKMKKISFRKSKKVAELLALKTFRTLLVIINPLEDGDLSGNTLKYKTRNPQKTIAKLNSENIQKVIYDGVRIY